MTATLLAQGIVRATKELTSRKTGEVFGTEVSVMTQVGNTLGETLKVLVFDREETTALLKSLKPNGTVCWVVEVEAGRYGLGATFTREADESDRRAMHVGIPTLGSEPVGAVSK